MVGEYYYYYICLVQYITWMLFSGLESTCCLYYIYPSRRLASIMIRDGLAQYNLGCSCRALEWTSCLLRKRVGKSWVTLSHFVEPLPCLMEIGVKVLARKLEIQCLCAGVPEDRKVAFYERESGNHVSRPLAMAVASATPWPWHRPRLGHGRALGLIMAFVVFFVFLCSKFSLPETCYVWSCRGTI